jgi:hypothetical protein
MGLFGFLKKKQEEPVRNPEDCRDRPLEWFASDEGQALYAKAMGNADMMVKELTSDLIITQYNLNDYRTKPLYPCKWYREFLLAYARSRPDFVEKCAKKKKENKKHGDNDYVGPEDYLGIGGRGALDVACFYAAKLDRALFEKKLEGSPSEAINAMAAPIRCSCASDPKENPILKFAIEFPLWSGMDELAHRSKRVGSLDDNSTYYSAFPCRFSFTRNLDSEVDAPKDWEEKGYNWKDIDDTFLYYSSYVTDVVIYLYKCIAAGKDISEDKWIYDIMMFYKPKPVGPYDNPADKNQEDLIDLVESEIQERMKQKASHPEELNF